MTIVSFSKATLTIRLFLRCGETDLNTLENNLKTHCRMNPNSARSCYLSLLSYYWRFEPRERVTVRITRSFFDTALTLKSTRRSLSWEFQHCSKDNSSPFREEDTVYTLCRLGLTKHHLQHQSSLIFTIATTYEQSIPKGQLTFLLHSTPIFENLCTL